MFVAVGTRDFIRDSAYLPTDAFVGRSLLKIGVDYADSGNFVSGRIIPVACVAIAAIAAIFTAASYVVKGVLLSTANSFGYEDITNYEGFADCAEKSFYCGYFTLMSVGIIFSTIISRTTLQGVDFREETVLEIDQLNEQLASLNERLDEGAERLSNTEGQLGDSEGVRAQLINERDVQLETRTALLGDLQQARSRLNDSETNLRGTQAQLCNQNSQAASLRQELQARPTDFALRSSQGENRRLSNELSRMNLISAENGELLLRCRELEGQIPRSPSPSLRFSVPQSISRLGSMSPRQSSRAPSTIRSALSFGRVESMPREESAAEIVRHNQDLDESRREYDALKAQFDAVREGFVAEMLSVQEAHSQTLAQIQNGDTQGLLDQIRQLTSQTELDRDIIGDLHVTMATLQRRSSVDSPNTRGGFQVDHETETPAHVGRGRRRRTQQGARRGSIGPG